jgi:hypothetical protein
MKKLLSIILSITMLAAVAVFPITVKAETKDKSSQEATYIASSDIYKNSFGSVYIKSQKLIGENSKGKKAVLVNFNKEDINCFDISFYMRGKTVYYYCNINDSGTADSKIYSVKIDGTQKL